MSASLLADAEALVPTVVARAAAVRARIASAGDPARVRIVAVTKGFGPEVAVAAALAGLADVGENYADELVAKAQALAGLGIAVRWHFLGALQTNKINRLAPHVALWQTVDSARRAEALGKRVPGAAVLVEVDIPAVAGRSGCPPDEVGAVVDAARAVGLDVRGLMGVGPDPDVVGEAANRAAFDRLAALARALGLDELSMGMTHDLEAAVAAGATMVRVGEALFGPRPTSRTTSRTADTAPETAGNETAPARAGDTTGTTLASTREGRAGRWPASGTR